METWFEAGGIFAAVAGVITLELLVLSALALRRERRRELLGLIPTIAAGGLLTLAFASRHAGFGWRVGATLLAMAGITHLIDLALRWRGPRGL